MADIVGPISVEPLLDGAGRYSQCLSPCRRLNRLKIQAVDRPRPYEPFDLRGDLRVEGLFEAPFLTASSETPPGSESNTSHNLSLTSTSSPVSLRRRRYSAICSCVCETALGGMILVTVLPSTLRVSDQLGPWPPSISSAQWQLALPHFR